MSPSETSGFVLAAWKISLITSAERHNCFQVVEVVLSTFIIEELRRVLPRLEHRHHLTCDEIDDLPDILSIQAEILDPHIPDEPLLRDSNDLPVLGTLLAALPSSNIDYLITGDKDCSSSLGVIGSFHLPTSGRNTAVSEWTVIAS